MLVILVMSLICWKIADAVEHISKYCKLYDMKVNIEKSRNICVIKKTSNAVVLGECGCWPLVCAYIPM